LEIWDRSPLTKTTARGERILNVAQPGIYTLLPVFVLEGDLARLAAAIEQAREQARELGRAMEGRE
jgi:hypothetical protein